MEKIKKTIIYFLTIPSNSFRFLGDLINGKIIEKFLMKRKVFLSNLPEKTAKKISFGVPFWIINIFIIISYFFTDMDFFIIPILSVGGFFVIWLLMMLILDT